jgi:hypothetical protein
LIVPNLVGFDLADGRPFSEWPTIQSEREQHFLQRRFWSTRAAIFSITTLTFAIGRVGEHQARDQAAVQAALFNATALDHCVEDKVYSAQIDKDALAVRNRRTGQTAIPKDRDHR